MALFLSRSTFDDATCNILIHSTFSYAEHSLNLLETTDHRCFYLFFMADTNTAALNPCGLLKLDLFDTSLLEITQMKHSQSSYLLYI